MNNLPKLLVLIAMTLIGCSTHRDPPSSTAVFNFEGCVRAGNQVLKTSPPQCQTPDGRVFTGIRGYSDQVIAQNNNSNIQSFEACVAAGFAIQKSFPPQCTTSDGRTFSQESKPINAPPAQHGIGMCKNQCGDGRCDQIVCMAGGCPCPESKANCPKDCT